MKTEKVDVEIAVPADGITFLYRGQRFCRVACRCSEDTTLPFFVPCPDTFELRGVRLALLPTEIVAPDDFFHVSMLRGSSGEVVARIDVPVMEPCVSFQSPLLIESLHAWQMRIRYVPAAGEHRSVDVTPSFIGTLMSVCR